MLGIQSEEYILRIRQRSEITINLKLKSKMGFKIDGIFKYRN